MSANRQQLVYEVVRRMRLVTSKSYMDLQKELGSLSEMALRDMISMLREAEYQLTTANRKAKQYRLGIRI